jgi:hypothetical protein
MGEHIRKVMDVVGLGSAATRVTRPSGTANAQDTGPNDLQDNLRDFGWTIHVFYFTGKSRMVSPTSAVIGGSNWCHFFLSPP